MIYRMKKWLFERWEKRFRPIIPQELCNLGKKYGVDMYRVRYERKKLSVQQVDELLEQIPKFENNLLDVQTRMTLKNMLVGYKLMDGGEMEVRLESEFERTFLSGRNLVKPEQLWKRGQSFQRDSFTKRFRQKSEDFKYKQIERWRKYVGVFNDHAKRWKEKIGFGFGSGNKG